MEFRRWAYPKDWRLDTDEPDSDEEDRNVSILTEDEKDGIDLFSFIEDQAYQKHCVECKKLRKAIQSAQTADISKATRVYTAFFLLEPVLFLFEVCNKAGGINSDVVVALLGGVGRLEPEGM